MALWRRFTRTPWPSNCAGLNYLRATGLETCLLINFGKAKIEVRRLGMSRGKGTGEIELDGKDLSSEPLHPARRPMAGNEGDVRG